MRVSSARSPNFIASRATKLLLFQMLVLFVNCEPQLNCHEKGLVLFRDKCHPLLSQGPCESGQWLQLNKMNTVVCAVKACSNPEVQVFWPELCTCINTNETDVSKGYTQEDICGRGSDLVWGPHGEGVCVCKENNYADTNGTCHELGSVGPCYDGQIWGAVNGSAQCIENYDKIRVFDLIPANNPPKSRSAQTRSCHMDENGNCRKTLNLRGRFGNADNFTSWLAGFSKRAGDKCEIKKCDDGKIIWHDGNCYPLASRGPCKRENWLLLENIAGNIPIIKCKNRKCQQGVWSSKSCSCVQGTFCDKNEDTLIDPYGNGVCSCKDSYVRHSNGDCFKVGSIGPCASDQIFVWDGLKGVCEARELKRRIFDLIPANVPSTRSSGGIGRTTQQNCGNANWCN